MFNKEFKFECEKCGNVWYATSKEIKQSKQIKKNMTMLKMERFRLRSMKTIHNQNAQMAQMKMAYIDYDKCANCGSHYVIKTQE